MADKEEQTTNHLRDYITSAEAARVLGLSQRRIAQLCTEGDLQGVKIARRWLVKRESVYAHKSGR